MRTIASTDNIALAVHGPFGHGPDVLFAHASGFHGLVWAPLATRLHDRFRCWSLDFRGHGLSFAPRDYAFDWHAFGQDVHAVVGGLRLDRPIGVGHSKGGAALLMAELTRPGTFRALYLYEPIVIPPEMATWDGPNPMADAARRRRSSFASRDEAYANYAAKPPLSVLHPDALRAYVDHGFVGGLDGRVHLACRPEHEARVFEMSRSHDTWNDLGRIDCPVVIAAGGDGERPAEFAPGIAERIPGARLEIFAGLGHFGPLQDPDRLAGAIAAFMS
jgi:pimeloyl-ACP methyl ester carboxylesterase